MGIGLNQRITVKDGLGGVIRYIGRVDGKDGKWVGIELDSPCGLNDGTHNEHRYFDCEPRHGLFIRMKTERSEHNHDGLNRKGASRETPTDTVEVNNRMIDEEPDHFNPNWSLFGDYNSLSNKEEQWRAAGSVGNGPANRGDVPRDSLQAGAHESSRGNALAERYKQLFFRLAENTKGSLVRLSVELDSVRRRIEKIQAFQIERDDHDLVVSLVASIYERHLSREYEDIEILYEQFTKLMSKYKIQVD